MCDPINLALQGPRKKEYCAVTKSSFWLTSCPSLQLARPHQTNLKKGLAWLLPLFPGSFPLFSLSFRLFLASWWVWLCKPFLGALESVAHLLHHCQSTLKSCCRIVNTQRGPFSLCSSHSWLVKVGTGNQKCFLSGHCGAEGLEDPYYWLNISDGCRNIEWGIFISNDDGEKVNGCQLHWTHNRQWTRISYMPMSFNHSIGSLSASLSPFSLCHCCVLISERWRAMEEHKFHWNHLIISPPVSPVQSLLLGD